MDSLTESNETYAIVIGTVFGITTWTGYYKFSIAAHKLYILSPEFQKKITTDRHELRRSKRKKEKEDEVNKKLCTSSSEDEIDELKDEI